MQRITADSPAPLFDVATTRRIEAAAARGLPPHALMQRAGLSAARLAMALAPHAHPIWVACGPGNNGGDGFEAALQLKLRGFHPIVTWTGDAARAPADARRALQRAQDAGVVFTNLPPRVYGLAIDALLGIGATRPPEARMADWLQQMHAGAAPVLSIDVPTGLNADTGTSTITHPTSSTERVARRHCLSLLTLKSGLFTAQGRDAAGNVWFDDLDVHHQEAPTAYLVGAPPSRRRLHATHKGSYGDVAIIGGAAGMAGAALLAASAALHGGAGRVFVIPLDPTADMRDSTLPELMFRRSATMDWRDMVVVCGCGGGDAVAAELPRVLSTASALVLDADALNAIARDDSLRTLLRKRSGRAWRTVLTPHPLEAARLLGTGTPDVQANRLQAARSLADAFAATVVLKGSGSVIAVPGDIPRINSTGNARLAVAGTGDVLAGMIGAALANGRTAADAACEAVWHHGALADGWPEDQPLTAGALARRGAPLTGMPS